MSLGESPVRGELWDEIGEIERDPEGRGTPYADADADPEFADLRIDLAVAGYAIFYVGPPGRPGVYVTSINLWEFAPER